MGKNGRKKKFTYFHPVTKKKITLGANQSDKQSSCTWLRSSRVNPKQENQYYILVEPLNQQIQYQAMPNPEKTLSCPECKAYSNKLWLESSSQFTCNICHRSIPKNCAQTVPFDSLFGKFTHEMQSEKTVFILEASAEIYKNNVHRSILACLKVLQEECEQNGHLVREVGFVVLDGNEVYALEGNKVVKIMLHQFCDLPFLLLEKLHALDLCIIQTILQSILSEGRQGLKLQSLSILHKVEVPCKVFISSLPLKISPPARSQIYVIGSKDCCSVMDALADDVYKWYDSGKVYERLYYDVFEALTQQSFTNVRVELSAPTGVQLLGVFHGKRLYHRSPVGLHIKMKSALPQHLQVKVLSDGGTLVINLKVESSRWESDVMFYALVERCLGEKKLNLMNEALSEMLRGMRQNGKVVMRRDLSNLFMYGYLIQKHGCWNPRNPLHRWQQHSLSSHGLHSLISHLYPITYQLYPEIQQIKYQEEKLSRAPLLLISNSHTLTLILNNCPTHLVLELFGQSDIEYICSLHQVPIIQRHKQTGLNCQVRDLIEWLQSEQDHFLRLQISTDECAFYYNLIKRAYNEQEHRQFLKKLLS